MRLAHRSAHHGHGLPGLPEGRPILIHLVPDRLAIQVHACYVAVLIVILWIDLVVIVLHRVVHNLLGVVVDRVHEGAIDFVVKWPN